MAVDKEIKFKFVVDQASLQSAKNQIQQLISAFATLQGQAKSANEATTQAFQGLVDVSGRPITSGGGGQSSTPVTTSGSSVVTKKISPTASTNVSASLTEIINRHKNVYKGIAQSGKEGVDMLTHALKRSVNEQISEIDKLEKQIQKITKAYSEAAEEYQKAIASGDTERASGLQKDTEGMLKERIQLEAASLDAKDRLRSTKSLQSTEEEKAEVYKNKYLTGQGLWSNLTASRGMAGQLSPGAGGLTNMLLPMLRGIGVGRLGLASIGAWGMQNIANQLWNGPNFQAQADAAYGQAFAGRSLDMRTGELRNIAKEQEILSDPTKREEYRSLGGGFRRALYNIKAFTEGRFNEAISGQAAEISIKKSRDERIAMERASNPLIDQILGEAQDYRSTLGKMRALGIGAKGGETGFAALNRIRAIAPTFSDEEIIGAKQSIESAGTRRTALGLTSGVLQGQAAGIAGIAQSTGVMSNFGAGRQFLGAARGYVGGGVDAVTAGIIAQEVARQQQQLGLATGSIGGGFQGEGLMAMLAGGTSDKVFGRLNAEQNIRGAAYMQQSLAGNTSAYQRARNLMIAAQVAPDLSSYGQSFLAKNMSLTEMADIAYGKGGDVSDVAKSYGITTRHAKDFFREQSKSLMEGISFSGMGGSNAGRLAKMLTESGMDPREFFKKRMWKGEFRDEKEALAAYAGALKAGDNTLDASSAMGLARNLSGIGGAKRGGMAGDAAGGSPEAKLASEHVKLMGTQAIQAASALERLTKAANGAAVAQEIESQLNERKAGSEERRVYTEALAELSQTDITDRKEQLEFVKQKVFEKQIMEELDEAGDNIPQTKAISIMGKFSGGASGKSAKAFIEKNPKYGYLSKKIKRVQD